MTPNHGVGGLAEGFLPGLQTGRDDPDEFGAKLLRVGDPPFYQMIGHLLRLDAGEDGEPRAVRVITNRRRSAKSRTRLT